jgi:hypothetical protein
MGRICLHSQLLHLDIKSFSPAIKIAAKKKNLVLRLLVATFSANCHEKALSLPGCSLNVLYRASQNLSGALGKLLVGKKNLWEGQKNLSEASLLKSRLKFLIIKQ